MSTRTLAFCLALFCAFLLVAGHARAEDEEQLERATIDVSDLLVRRVPTQAPILDLWPSNYTPRERDTPERNALGDGPGTGFLTDGDIMEIVKLRVVPRSWEEVNGANIEVRSGRLRVRNRPGVVRDVRAYIQALRAQASQRVNLQLGVKRGSPASYPSPSGDGAPGESVSMVLMPGVEQGAEVLKRKLYIQDYEVEIAQGSIIGNPVCLDALSGLVAEMIATPTVQGDQVIVSGVIQHAKLLGLRTVETGIDEEYLPRPYRSDERLRNGRIELPTLRTTAVVANMVMTPGRDLSIPVVYGGAQEDFWIRATATGGKPAPALHTLGALAQKPFEGYASWYGGMGMDLWRYYKAGFPTLVIPMRGNVYSAHPAEELLEDMKADMMGSMNIGSSTALVFRPDLLFVNVQPEFQKRVRAYLARTEQPLLRGATVDVRVLSLPSGVATPGAGQRITAEGAELLAAGRVPTLHGRRGALITGTMHAHLPDYDVEVAQEARIADPIVDVCFDGLVVNLRPYYPAGTDVAEISVQFAYSTQTPVPSGYDSGARYLGPIDRVEGDVRQFETSVRMKMGSSFVFDAGRDPRMQSRQLVVELTLLPR